MWFLDKSIDDIWWWYYSDDDIYIYIYIYGYQYANHGAEIFIYKTGPCTWGTAVGKDSRFFNYDSHMRVLQSECTLIYQVLFHWEWVENFVPLTWNGWSQTWLQSVVPWLADLWLCLGPWCRSWVIKDCWRMRGKEWEQWLWIPRWIWLEAFCVRRKFASTYGFSDN